MPPSAIRLWDRAMSALREKIPERTIENWLVDAVPKSINDAGGRASMVLCVPSSFCREYILSNFRREVEGTLSELLDRPVELKLKVDSSMERDSAETSSGGSSNGEPASSQAAPPDTSDASEDPSSGCDDEKRAPLPRGDGASDQEAERTASPPAEPSSQTKKAAPFSAEGLPSAHEAGPGEPASTHSSGETAEREVFPSPDRREPARRGTEHKADPPPSAGHSSFPDQEQNLRPEFTFENFLEGDSNQLARSASVAVAKEPGGTKYNPLVVYGEVGLGKTHLAQAITNHAVEHNTASTICYVSSERFTSQFVTAIREDDFQSFSAHYRNVDLLVVDDVQFFGGKEKTQEEFFHLFNDLHQNGKQIVLCADRPPSKISGIEDRLLSRFQWGLTADIQRPDLEMRMAVLQLKANHLDLELDPQVLEILAENITENIRQLEGALKQLAARDTLTNGGVDVELVREVLEREYGVGTEPRKPNLEDIMKGVATYFSLSTDDLVSRNRTQEISNARQVAMYLAREMTSLSYSSIGLRFGGRDHSTAIHACNKVEDQLEVQQQFDEKLEKVRSAVRRHLRSR